MGFYREKIVKKPTKIHKCNICGLEIKGEHVYRTGVWEGDFFSVREHSKCNFQITQMCSNCDDYCDGTCDVFDCYFELQEERRKAKEAKRS